MLDFIDSDFSAERMREMNEAVWLLIGIILGGIVAWIVAFKVGTERSKGAEGELRSQLQQRESELTSVRVRLSESEQERSSTQALAARVPDLEQAASEARAEVAALRERSGKAEAQAGAVAQQLIEQRKQHERALADLESKFKALSAEALDKNSKTFLTLAQETLSKFQEIAKGDLTQRHQAIETLLKPLQQSLGVYQQRLQQGETQQSKLLGELQQQLRSLAEQSTRLQAETGHLVTALKAPQSRGRWGEITLQRVVEIAGLSQHCDFETQVSVDTEEGRLRPDLVVRLPQNKTVVVDSKVPLKAYLEAMEAADEPTRQAALARHSQAVRKHMKDLSGKAYWSQFDNTPEFVVLFLPGESFFSAALEQDRAITEDGMSSGVFVATPITLIALLRTVAASWQQQAQTENAQKIAEAGAELFDRISKFAEHIAKIRRGLEIATDSYNDATGSFERMLLPGARKLKELRVVSEERALPDPQKLDSKLRPPPDAGIP